MPPLPSCDSTTSERLASIGRELELLHSRLLEVAGIARGLAAQTDWHSRSAAAFHIEAGDWADDVARIGWLIDTARRTVAAAQSRAFMRDFWGCG